MSGSEESKQKIKGLLHNIIITNTYIQNMEDKDRYDAVVSYVEAKYPKYKNKSLIVKEFDSHFRVNLHENGSPLVLSKNILNK